MRKISVGIVGGTGYTGVELLRILVQHPQVEIAAITSRQEVGRPVAEAFPNLRGWLNHVFLDPADSALHHCDLVFFATPNGIAMRDAPTLLDAGVRVIDLAADFRLKDVAEWERWYGMKHTAPDWIDRAVYGLPEVNRAVIREARLVANPGCYPTAVQLGFLPLVETGLIASDSLIADAKSGVSGAGRKAETHILFAEATDNFRAYGVAGHRHLPEIKQGLKRAGKCAQELVFVPHLTPMIRGIYATLYGKLTREEDLQSVFERRYAHEPFIDVLPSGCLPETRHVRAGNYCRLAVHRPPDSDRVVVLSVIDNLVRGAAGQAVQNMNIMFSFDERSGLSTPAILP